MTEDGGARASADQSTMPNDPSQTRQRKKRKWDQPAEALVSAGVALPGILPFGNVGSLVGSSLPAVTPISGSLLTNPLSASCTINPLFQAPLLQQASAAAVPKLNQPKIQDELIIAREIVINDAESSIRYKLTKRQTQEEIQRCTGAVVITRGKYRPLNAPSDGERPLYLHISAGAHLKETAEQILAVDRAAAMVEEMLKQGQNLQPALSAISNGVKALSTCVFLGFEVDPSLNIAARIRGPNDQYINHIMNETGATVLLRGRGSGVSDCLNGEEPQQPLHLLLSCNNPRSLEDAKRLAENLMDTISLESGASRVSSSKVYNAVPPPQQLLAGAQSSESEQSASSAALTSPVVGLMAAPPASSVVVPGVASVLSQGLVSSSVVQAQPNLVGPPQPSLSGGTSYNGYGGIYPQATPLQQVALALRQSPAPVASTATPAASVTSTAPKSSVNSISEKERRVQQKRKFQELPVGSKAPANTHQGSELLKPSETLAGFGVRNVSTMPAPKKLVQQSSNGMPSPPPRFMPPLPPPPKFTSPTPAVKFHDKKNTLNKTNSDAVPDTLVKLMEYGEEDEDAEGTSEEPLVSNVSSVASRKPFWAV